MAKNKIITSQGNVQFINSKGRTIDMHPMHCYAIYENDTVSFLFIYMKEYSGQAFFASQYEDLELNGDTYDSLDELKDAINYEFAKAGAQARTEIVTELPEDPFTNTIYLLPKEHGQGYDEYIWNEDEGWQLIGDTDIEFERYLKIEDFNPYSADTKDYIDAVSGNTVQNASDIVSLSGAIDTEISARTDADTALSGAIDSVASDLADEVSARTQADTTLQNNITSVNNRVDAEQIARANADNALSGAIDSVDSKVDTLSGEVETMGDEAIVDAEYVSSSTTIDFYNASGSVVAQVDATDFIKDGMIEDVRIETISGVTYLVIDFNTASGKEDIKIPLSDIFDPDNYYDKTAIDNIVSGLNNSIDAKVSISDFNTYSGAVETELGNKFDASGITAYSTSAEVTAEIEAATSGLQQSLSAGTALDITDNVISFTLPISAGTGNRSIVQGQGTKATAPNSHAEGYFTEATGSNSHAEGSVTKATGSYSHAEGATTSATSEGSHAEGIQTLANGKFSHAEGIQTETKNSGEHANGRYNISSSASTTVGDSGNTTFSIGNGVFDTTLGINSRHNAFEVRENGDIYIADTNASGEFYEKPMIKIQDALAAASGSGISSAECQTMIDQSISGKVDTSDFNTYSGATDSRLTEDEEVISAALNVLNESINAVSGAIPTTTSVVASGSTAVVESRGVYTQMDGLRLRKLTQIAYDRILIKDNNTLYIIVD